MRTRSQRARSRWLRFNAVPVAKNSAAMLVRSSFFISSLPLIPRPILRGMHCNHNPQPKRRCSSRDLYSHARAKSGLALSLDHFL
jgi:hypothetical protein